MLFYLFFTIIKQITHIIIGFINTFEMSTEKFNIKYGLPLICFVGISYYTQKEKFAVDSYGENGYLFDYIMYELISFLLIFTFIGTPMISTKKDTNRKIDLTLATISWQIDELKLLSIKQYELHEIITLFDKNNQTLNELTCKIDENNKTFKSFSTRQNKLIESLNINIDVKEKCDIIEQKLVLFSQMFSDYDKSLTYNNELINKYNKTLSQFTVKSKKNNIIDLTDDSINVVTVEIDNDKEKKIIKKTIGNIIERFSDVVKDTDINRRDVITIKKNLNECFT